jgi:hypothetical protein
VSVTRRESGRHWRRARGARFRESCSDAVVVRAGVRVADQIADHRKVGRREPDGDDG